MAAQVTVIATDLRRATVKVSPGTFLTDVLEEACRKLSLDSGRYLLKTSKKQVDLSLTFRNSGLVPGAKLELVLKSNTPSAVTVGLQVPPPEGNSIPNGRLSDKFPSDFTIWQVLRQFESGKASAAASGGLNITGRSVPRMTGQTSGELYYETPVLNVVGRELASFADFQKTLSQLGYNSGSVLMRLSFRKTDKTLMAAMEEANQYFKNEETEKLAAEQSATEQPTEEAATEASTDAAATPQAQVDTEPLTAVTSTTSETKETPAPPTEPMDVDSTPQQLDPLMPLHVYSAPTSSAPAAALTQEPDTAFMPTIAHAQLHQQRLQQSSLPKRLPSDRELEARAAEEAARLASVASVDVKVRFPDNTSAQWRFGRDDTAAVLYRAVRSVMADPGLAFRLLLPGDKAPLRDDDGPAHKLIAGYKMRDKVLISLVWAEDVSPAARRRPFLSGAVAKQAMEMPVPRIPEGVPEKDAEEKPLEQFTKAVEDVGKDIAKKVPKWLKLGKK